MFNFQRLMQECHGLAARVPRGVFSLAFFPRFLLTDPAKGIYSFLGIQKSGLQASLAIV
jgi:hypothetical protein